ncbi:MAG TPA: hypothetical protein VHU22_20965 [Xanthobacteraceae bacterium]|jgi:hypothetical protein|nr:hypothetical protein [Xanthobacteraceae bacterium]
MARNLVLIIALLLFASQITASAQNMTVQSLMNEGYTVAGVITSPAGPGVFLQNGKALLVCFVAEKPESPAVTTQYCKPVK